MGADETLAARHCFLALAGKLQAGPRFPGCGFHSWVRRIFAVALKRNFNPGGIRYGKLRDVSRNEALLAQSSRGYLEMENQVARFPFKRVFNLCSRRKSRKRRH